MTASFPLTVVATLLVIAAFCFGLKLAATAGDKRANAHRELLRNATPAHDQSRAGDFDEWGRTW